MKRILTAATVLFASFGAHASLYDNEFCERVGKASGSYSIQLACQDDERKALGEIGRTDIPRDILRRCSEIGEAAAGGSWRIIMTCSKSEMEAKRRLGK